MQVFTEIIQRGVQLSAQKVVLRQGEKPEFIGPAGPIACEQFQPLDGPMLLKLCSMVFPQNPDYASQKPALQAVPIGGGHQIAIVFVPGASILLKIFFPPEGLVLAEQEHKALMEALRGAPKAPVVAQKTPVAPSSPSGGGDLPVINFGSRSAAEERAQTGAGNPIDALLREMVARKASDLHLTMNEPPMFRIDGEIVRTEKAPVDAATMEKYILNIIPERNLREFAEINDTDFAYEVPNLSRFRVNVFRDRNGVCSVMRNIPSKILTAEQLDLPKAITNFCSLTKGLVLVTGPTGSGKSTTLAAMLDLINKSRHDHILTIEDPIEFVHPQQRCLVNQREVHRHTNSFSKALRAALREDPDIVLIGEMRDLETISTAIETAETGHLVFGTLHTNTASSTVDRIIDQFPADRQSQIRTMLASSLKGVVSQMLIKKKGGGRVAAHEILVSDDAIASMIREAKNHMIPGHMQMSKAKGNRLLNESILSFVKADQIEFVDGLAKAVDKRGLLAGARALGMKVDEFDTEKQDHSVANPERQPAPAKR
jgi:twitching motility protein PilT